MDPLADSLKRRTRLTAISTGKRVRLTERDLLWLHKLNEHGPLSSSFLLAYSRHSRQSEKRSRERLADLFHEQETPDGGPYLVRPSQQFRTLDSRYNQLVYDLAPAGVRALRRLESGSVSKPVSGPWLHRFMASSITASIEIAVLQSGSLRYISEREILARANAPLRFPVPTQAGKRSPDLIPDALFGLEYLTHAGSRFRFFAVEADRATEPLSGAFNRKSAERSFLQYERYAAGGLYREHLKLTAPLLVLFVSSDPRRTASMVTLAERHFSTAGEYFLFQTWEDFGPVFRPPVPNLALLTAPWVRAGLCSFWIDQA